MLQSSSLPDNVSVAEWKGSRPTRFAGGRKHIQPIDQLDFAFVGRDEPARGKKHFQARYSSQLMSNKESVKMYPDRYKRSDIFDTVELKKLIYVPMTKLKFPSLQKAAISNLTKLQEIKLGLRTNGIYRNFAKQRQNSSNKEQTLQGAISGMSTPGGDFRSLKQTINNRHS